MANRTLFVQGDGTRRPFVHDHCDERPWVIACNTDNGFRAAKVSARSDVDAARIALALFGGEAVNGRVFVNIPPWSRDYVNCICTYVAPTEVGSDEPTLLRCREGMIVCGEE